MTSPKSVRLKDRDYDVTPNIIAHMYPQIRNGSVKDARWRWSVKSARCTVKMVVEEWPVGRGEVKTWNAARCTRANVNAPC